MKSIINKEVEVSMSKFAEADKDVQDIINAMASSVFSNLTKAEVSDIKVISDGTDEVPADVTKAKILIKAGVRSILGFDNKNTLSSYKRSIASKYYDNKKTKVFIREHFDRDSGVDFRKDKVTIDSKFAYNLSDKAFKSMKNKTGVYLSDGKAIQSIVKIERERIATNCDAVVSRYIGKVTVAVEKLLGINTVTGTQLPIKLALNGKLEKLNDYYFNNNETLSDSNNKEWKIWIASMPTWIKATK
tara:strand:+ start:294 stop:1028 length:735 start_codon:yes stop_codon:yes gene_type:complete